MLMFRLFRYLVWALSGLPECQQSQQLGLLLLPAQLHPALHPRLVVQGLRQDQIRHRGVHVVVVY